MAWTATNIVDFVQSFQALNWARHLSKLITAHIYIILIQHDITHNIFMSNILMKTNIKEFQLLDAMTSISSGLKSDAVNRAAILTNTSVTTDPILDAVHHSHANEDTRLQAL